jgi:hypothetical protein
LVEKLISEDAKALALFRKYTTAQHGGDRKSKADNVSLAPKRGTSRAYTLDRLRDERADLFARVQAGELSAHAAAIEAGWRKRATPLDQVRTLWRKLSAHERTKRKRRRAGRAFAC